MSIGKPVLTALGAFCLALGLSIPAMGTVPAHLPVSKAPVNLEVVQVQQKSGRQYRGYYRGKQGHYYNGYRGYRKYRRGYRRYNGWWFPPVAFPYGLRVLPPQRYIAPPPLVIVPPAYTGYLPPVHYQWCARRYRSYRAVDNSFQPYRGPRRACVSPYGP
ncbi:BA14K family protein [Roseibium sp. Sym1]|uniref:BA14K family protein n=1 Tax=Roseibium sp. Sym1 TaxID=3016006 RepID=UPI0022B35E07|nr:BA14K family protein [Roseibium sp. Sym1]